MLRFRNYRTSSRKIEGPLLAGYQIINIRVGGGVGSGYYMEVLLLACLLQGGGGLL